VRHEPTECHTSFICLAVVRQVLSAGKNLRRKANPEGRSFLKQTCQSRRSTHLDRAEPRNPAGQTAPTTSALAGEKRLCWISSEAWCFRRVIPGGVCFDDGVEDDEELSDAGGEYDFGSFSCVFESLSEYLEEGVMSGGGKGSHVENIPKGFSSSTNGAFSVTISTVIIEGSHADERRDFLAAELSEFRKFRNECCGGDIPDSRDGFEQFETLLPVVIGEQQFENGAIKPEDVRGEGFERALETFSDERVEIVSEAVGFCRAELHELSSSCDELIENGLFFGGFGEWSGFDIESEPSNDASVDPIGFGEDSESFGIISDLSGIDDGDGVSGVGEFPDNSAFIVARGFKNDKAASRCGQFGEQLMMSLGRVWDTTGRALGQLMSVECVFGDIDSNDTGDTRFHEDDPSLQMRARSCQYCGAAHAAVRVRIRRPATIPLLHGFPAVTHGGPKGHRSVAGHCGGSSFAMLRNCPHSVFHISGCWL
jgi:hypothetical protein